MRKGFKRFAVLAGVVSVFAAVTAPPASALAVGPLEVRIDVDTSSWDATGLVSDDLSGATYTTVLTATGIQTDGFRHGTVIDFDTATGNPAYTSTEGGFDSQYAGVQYTLTWTSVLGTTGTFTRTCFEVLGVPVCTPT